jgi:hypothetical protein
MISANDGPGGEPTRRSAVPSPLPPNRDNVPVPSSFGVAPPVATAVVGGRHCSLVIVPLSGTVAVIFLVLLLPFERTPIPDHETHLRRATYNKAGSLGVNPRARAVVVVGPVLRTIHGDSPPSSVSLSVALGAPIAPRMTLAQSRNFRPPLLLFPYQLFPHWDCDDCPAPSLAFGLPPLPADPDPIGGDATTPKEPNSASSSLSLSTRLPHQRHFHALVDPSCAALST